ncbi:helix-turn-helix domain-containing protein [Streptacidiphilus sp. MAP5-3]|uniref:helix-turn-helix domain-containing protein n=1 Tax=unclassified Streptacidiphilus TaxID=2643834 RepID=UPI0035183430
MFAASRADAQEALRRRHPGDLGRRVALRRHELGLSVDEVARRAGMSPGVVEWVETGPAELGPGEVGRLAAALDTSRKELLGGGSLETAPGQARPDRRTVTVELSDEECWSCLGRHGVGRVVFLMGGALIVRPVNYRVVDGVLLFRTQEGGVLCAAAGRRVVLEVDSPDVVVAQGWSVLVSGYAEVDRRDIDRSGILEGEPEPWANGPRDLLVRIRPNRFTGRELLLHAVDTGHTETDGGGSRVRER